MVATTFVGLTYLCVSLSVKHQSHNCTVSSDSWTDPFESTPQDSGVDYVNSNTELDLAEEHFSQPEVGPCCGDAHNVASEEPFFLFDVIVFHT